MSYSRYSPFCLSFAVASLISVAAYAQPSSQKPSQEKGPKALRLSMRHIESKGIGYNRGYSSVDFFGGFADRAAPFYPFFDVRMHVFNDGRFATNGGFGLRHLADGYVLGGNLFYDFRNTKQHNYNQLGAGFEYLSSVWDVYVNAYVPVGQIRSTLYDLDFDHFEKNYAIISQKREFAFYGVNAEAGAHVIRRKDIDLFAGVGPYYFYGQYGKNAVGGKARIKGLYQDILGFELSASYDSQFRGIVQGEISLTLPFGRRLAADKASSSDKASLDRIYNIKERLMQRPERMEIIVIDDHKKRSRAIDPTTGEPYFFVFANNIGLDADGTFESPWQSLNIAEFFSDPGNILYVIPGDPTLFCSFGSVNLQDRQRVWGASIPHTLATTQGSVRIPSESGAIPRITTAFASGTTAYGLRLANDNEVSGFEFDLNRMSGTDAIGIIGPNGISNADINQCTFINVADGSVLGMLFQDVSGEISLKNNAFEANTLASVTVAIQSLGISLFPDRGFAHYDISNNRFFGQLAGIAAEPSQTAVLDLDIAYNSFFDCAQGIDIEATNSADLEVEVVHNQFSLMDVASTLVQPGTFGSNVTCITRLNSSAHWNINDNDFSTSFGQRSVAVTAFDNSSGCVQFNDNHSLSTIYQFDGGSSVPLSIEPLENDTGTPTFLGSFVFVTPGTCD